MVGISTIASPTSVLYFIENMIRFFVFSK